MFGVEIFKSMFRDLSRPLNMYPSQSTGKKALFCRGTVPKAESQAKSCLERIEKAEKKSYSANFGELMDDVCIDYNTKKVSLGLFGHVFALAISPT